MDGNARDTGGRAGDELRFSPRPNRAHEIAWRPWGEAAFEEARRLGRPVLLSLSATWCHWCHVMDETSYSDPRVIAALNEHFVPVRVDNDRHPDVNRRYNMGGWPTTAFLTASGEVIAGATYLPPDQLLETLAKVKAFFDANRGALAGLSRATPAQAVDSEPLLAAGAAPGTRPRDGGGLDGDGGDGLAGAADAVAAIAAEALALFDPLHGGLGAAPKFPQPDVFHFLLAVELSRDSACAGDLGAAAAAAGLAPPRLREALRTTLEAIARGGLHDPVGHGFFRYATRRDWRQPHYEKMLEDNARLTTLYLDAALAAAACDLGDPALYRETAGRTLEYLLGTLWQEDLGAFAGSQDADEAYYALDAAARRDASPPALDRTVYVDWNALAARALLRAAAALGGDDLRRRAARLLDRLLAAAAPPGAAAGAPPLAHYLTPDGRRGEGSPLLVDQVAVAAALLDDYEGGGDRGRLAQAARLAAWVDEALSAPDGRLHDRLALPGDSAGLLAHPLPALDENGAAAEVFLRLAALTGDEAWRWRALRLLVAWGDRWRRHGVAAAAYGQALLRALEAPPQVVVVGRRDDPAAARLHAAALREPHPLRSAQWLDPGDEHDAALLRARDLPADAAAAVAFVCRGRACDLYRPA